MDISALTSLQQSSSLPSLFNTQSTTATSSDPMMAILQSQEQLITLSAVGKAAGQAHAVALGSGDPNAVAGLQQIMSAVSSSSLSADSFTALQTINKLASQAPDTLNAVLDNVNSLTQRGMSSSITSYLSAVNTSFSQGGATSVDTLNTGVTQTLSDTTTDTATVLQQLSTLFQQIQPATTAAASSTTTTAAPTYILADDPAYQLDVSA